MKSSLDENLDNCSVSGRDDPLLSCIYLPKEARPVRAKQLPLTQDISVVYRYFLSIFIFLVYIARVINGTQNMNKSKTKKLNPLESVLKPIAVKTG